MTVYSIQSKTDSSGQYTKLQLDDTTDLRLHFKSFTGGQGSNAITARLSIPFLIHFARYDLATNRMNWGYVEYRAAGRPLVTHTAAEQKLVLEYTANAQVVHPTRPS